MPLFCCSKCGCVENTAVGDYWTRRNNPQCSECSTGTWHGRFAKESATGYQIDEDGFIWHPEASVPSHLKIVGKVSQAT